MHKWTTLTAGVIMQTILGGIYAWSFFIPHLTSQYGFTNLQCSMIFGVTIATFTVAMIPAGRLLAKYGPRLTAGIGGAFFIAGYLLTAFSRGQYHLMLAGAGVTAGIGIGFAYSCPMTTGMQWFPRHKGLVTGVTVAGFGAGAILLSYMATFLMHRLELDVLNIFLVVAIFNGGILFAAAMCMRTPSPSEHTTPTKPHEPARHLSNQPGFALICIGMFAGTFAGLLCIGNLKAITLNMGLTSLQAAQSISLFAVGNALGRIIWGKIHDYLGSWRTMIFSLAFLGVALFMLVLPLPPAGLISITLLVGLGFGACFVVYASSLVEVFGIQSFPRLYPFCFLGYGLAGLIGPAFGGWMADTTGSYIPAILISLLIIFAVILIMHYKRRTGDGQEQTTGGNHHGERLG